MRHIISSFLMVSLLSISGFSQTLKPGYTADSKAQTEKASDEEKVYEPDEVYTKAVIKNPDKLEPMEFSPDC
jgi:hypothetical protein